MCTEDIVTVKDKHRFHITAAAQLQELSYRKQIARQLRTQFVEGIYRSDYIWS